MADSSGELKLRALVLRHRDDPSPTLAIDWALLRLLDKQHCEQLKSDLATFAPNGWEVHTATDNLHEMLADQPGLYMFVWRPWLRFDRAAPDAASNLVQILYVGLAGATRYPNDTNSHTLKRRYKQYRKYLRSEAGTLWSTSQPVSRDQRLGRYLTLRPLEYWCAVIEDADELNSIERRLIATLNPPCNIKDSPILMKVSGAESPAFAKE